MDRAAVLRRVVAIVSEIGEIDPEAITEDTRLVGSKAVVKSHQLVEILLMLEDLATDELNAKFDWTSDSAMSEDRSFLRSVGALTDKLHSLQASL